MTRQSLILSESSRRRSLEQLWEPGISALFLYLESNLARMYFFPLTEERGGPILLSGYVTQLMARDLSVRLDIILENCIPLWEFIGILLKVLNMGWYISRFEWK